MNDGIAKMGEVVFSGPELTALRALGLGSCIGLCVLDPMRKHGCLAHIMLPESRSTEVPQPGKFADTAVDYVVSEMAARGAATTVRFPENPGDGFFYAGDDMKVAHR